MTPGDYIFGNADGVVVIPETMAEEVLETAVIFTRAAIVIDDMLISSGGVIGVLSRRGQSYDSPDRPSIVLGTAMMAHTVGTIADSLHFLVLADQNQINQADE